MKVKTFYYVFILATVTVLSACGGGKDKDSEPVIHSVMTVRPGSSEGAMQKNFSGVVKENATVSLSFRAAGQIAHIYVKEGQHVQKGQLLAQLDTKDYQLAVDNAKVQVKQMRDQVARLKPLYENDALNANDYEQATSRLEVLEIQLRNAENQLSYTRLTAPVEGFIQSVNFEEAEMVGVGTCVFDIVDDHRREVEINVPNDVARDYGRYESSYCLHEGKRYPLDILSVLHKADANQLYTVKLGVNAPLRPGQSVDVYINVRASENAALTLPPDAVFEHEGKSCVWVLKDGKTVRRTVTIGKVDNRGRLIILDGLSANDEVVKAGVSYLQEGEEVRVVTNESSNVGDLL